MTRMRVIGLLGILSVAVGLLLVVFKLLYDHGFVWLVHRQLWVPTFATILYVILPVDWIVQRYNVSQVLKGNEASSIQIIAQPWSAEGMLPIIALADHETPEIREGVRGLMALWAKDLQIDAKDLPREGVTSVYRGGFRPQLGHTSPWLRTTVGFSQTGWRSDTAWQNWQAAERLLLARLLERSSDWAEYADNAYLRDRSINDFYKYAYRWY